MSPNESRTHQSNQPAHMISQPLDYWAIPAEAKTVPARKYRELYNTLRNVQTQINLLKKRFAKS